MSASLAAFLPDAAEPLTIEGLAVAEDTSTMLGEWVRCFEEAESASQQSRDMANQARAYYDGAQLTAEEMAALKRRRQPPIVNNRIKPKVQLLMGLERRGRSDPKAFPRTPNEDNRADTATQVLRYVVDDNRFDVIRSSVFENILIEGVGGCEVIVEPDDEDGYNVRMNHVPWERIFYDPHSQHPGFSDAQYLGVVIWMDRDEALATYPDAADILDGTFSSVGDGFDDRPNLWADSRRRRVRMVQMHQKRGSEWWTGTFTRGGFVQGPMLSPYLDRHGRPTCPLILRSAFCDRENNRYGVVRDLIPLQDALNKRESKLLHLLNVNQVLMENGAVDDVDMARTEAAKPDGVIVYNKGFDFRINRDQSEVAGHFQLLQYTMGQMNNSGPNASMAGKDPRDLSGRAIIAQQSGGQMEHEPIADTLRQWSHKVFEAAWMRARQFWTDEKSIRVTDENEGVQFITLNKRVTVMDELKAMVETGKPDEITKARGIAQQMGLVLGDPRLMQVLRMEHNLDDLDVDITVEEGPDNPTMQAEQFQQIMQLPPQMLEKFGPKFIIRASSLRNKDDLEKLLDEHDQKQAAAQEQQKQVMQAMQAAQIAKVQADAADKTASAGNKQASTFEKMHTLAIHPSTPGAYVAAVPDPLGAAPQMMEQPQLPGV